MTAQSFKDALDRARDPLLNGAQAQGVQTFSDIASTAADGTTLTITLSAPHYNLLQRLASPFACPVPSGTPHVPQASQPGSGPYTIDSIAPDRVVLVTNPHYGGTRPHAFAEIDFDLTVDPAAGEARVLNGDSDYLLGGPPVADTSSLQDTHPTQFLLSDQFGIQQLTLNTSRPPFNKVGLRLAVEYAVDRAALALIAGGPRPTS